MPPAGDRQNLMTAGDRQNLMTAGDRQNLMTAGDRQNLLTAGDRQAVSLHICCVRPGLMRGGVRHPRHAVHAADAFTAAQIAELLAEPALTVILGGQVATAAAVAAAAAPKTPAKGR
jgi:hypothetical protein